MQNSWFWAAAFLTASIAPAHAAEGPDDHPRQYVSFYMGKSVTNKFTSLFLEPHNARFEDTYLAAATYGYEVVRFGDYASIEIEGNAARRFGGADLWEFAVAGNFRWRRFPWNRHVLTTVSVSFGPSYATRISDTERRKGGGEGSKWLNFFSPEITFALPRYPRYEWLVRIHHRSGMFGAINNVSGGTNHLSTGFRYRF